MGPHRLTRHPRECGYFGVDISAQFLDDNGTMDAKIGKRYFGEIVAGSSWKVRRYQYAPVEAQTASIVTSRKSVSDQGRRSIYDVNSARDWSSSGSKNDKNCSVVMHRIRPVTGIVDCCLVESSLIFVNNPSSTLNIAILTFRSARNSANNSGIASVGLFRTPHRCETPWYLLSTYEGYSSNGTSYDIDS
ncbi:hypothetical protein P175DRAFT_0529384 [Aspergillus ochraceoroseus IBT 24754]|uniref:Uncharacterized protein n=1 Tax=Aspergillus ochraceoroseus IBT 24754 TaxID=1392256 RepID=A0A2T5M1C2_9EURO|nr:uncharacterized protein P175DRAFT_0529384 [Aspergillus ochraceoroseus IBT 24754]PTU22334.1 hypothetical protein P175DRAFT_0529384 [Aspergillus ochraceoroseus IBT 24754]